MIQNLIFGAYPLISDYLLESLQANKTSKKDHSFYNTVSLKIPNSFYEPQLTEHYKKIYYSNTAKNLTHFTNFPAKMFLVACQEKTLALHHF